MWRVAAFAVGSIGLICVSRKALARPRSHGFYRFFAWELMLVLLLLNLPRWFTNWLAWHQLISWFLLVVCIVPLAYGVKALSKRGEPDAAQRAEPELMAFERTTKLVTDGVYRYIRHPLYSSLFLLNWGIFFKAPSWIGLALAATASLLLVATARADERECVECFGTEYQQYVRHTRMFIPYIL